MLALLATLLLLALGIGLLTVGDAERTISANQRTSAQALYAADAGIERALADLLLAPRWSDVLRGDSSSSFEDGTVAPTTPWGQRLDLVQMTTERQRQSDGARPPGPDNPRWRLYAYGPTSALTSVATDATYLVVWVADDLSESDDDPSADTNGVISLLAEAIGPNGADRIVEVTASRGASHATGADEGAERGGDGTNHRSVTAPVETPGKAITAMALSLGAGGLVVP